ncbi:MAG: hypothetical protein H0X24_13820 [Ktedonobacterales bacterium]|nr:hypothetical protein [Ktedonobacterales bacterium]
MAWLNPLTPLFVGGVLKAFGQTDTKDQVAQMKELLHLWDTRMPDVTSANNPYQQEIIDEARAYIQCR